MRKRRLLGLAFGLVAVLAFGLTIGVGKMPGQTDGPKAQGKEGLGHGKRAQDFLTAFNRGDAKAVAGFWTPAGDYVDQVGRQTKGRAALEKMYEKFFAARKGAKLTLTVISVRLIAPEVALEEGITEVTSPDGPPTAARFSAVLVKKDGEWYFESVHDAVARPPSNADRFEDLEWLIGEWSGAESKGESARASYGWAENKNFIVSSFATTVNGAAVVGGTQWIGWDAVDKQIRSYSFYSGGGMGEALWTKNDGKWLIKTTAKTADGRRISGLNVVTQLDADNATWQLTNLNVDGKTMPDAPAIRLKRVKAEPK